MAALKGAKTIGAEFPNAVHLVRVTYDFSVDTGAQATYDVFTASQDLVILGCYFNVKTLCTSGGSATVSLGYDTDVDALIDETAVASLAAGALIQPIVIEGTPNVLPMPYKVASAKKVNMTIGTADLTAGKIEIVLMIAKF